ncbi:MAG: histidine kinase [Devosia sp.]|nr:histidine kinase [Devosia sp.]
MHDFQDDIDAVARIGAVRNILDVVCRTTGMGFAAVARVTDDRWIACEVLDHIDFGLKSGGELAIATTICNEIRQTGDGVVIDHVANDAAYYGHPTPAKYGFQSYISMPITRSDGSFFGTLCAIDPQPKKLQNTHTIDMFRLFAQLIASQLDADEKFKAAEKDLLGERQMAELRDQFIAVLGHDLRNPVASLGAGAKMLLDTPLNERATRIVTLMQGSVIRMGGLIDNLLDFARGRLGGGLMIDRSTAVDLAPVLQQVADELRSVTPDRRIELTLALDSFVACDPARIGQMFSNLLGNAITHGSPETPVRAEARADADGFVLSVANGGEPIPDGSIASLFLPFSRGQGNANQTGLGLGLYIAAEIVRAHGGTLTVASTATETRFTATLPSA